MKFAHLADCHIGGWREPVLRELNNRAFSEAVARCLAEKVDFVLIAGDLFNTSLPALDSLRSAVAGLRELKEAGIPVYAVPGSHDYSPSGRTIVDVLESAGLLVNVVNEEANFVVDKKTGAKLIGLPGWKGGLDQSLFSSIDKSALEAEKGFKIFLFHTTVKELITKDFEMIPSVPASAFPEGFDYYAGGHIHIVSRHRFGKGFMVYPGPLFPNNFSELEKLGAGGFFVYEDGKLEHVRLELCPVRPLVLDCNHKRPAEICQEIAHRIDQLELKGALLLVRLYGSLAGKSTEIPFNELFARAYEKGALFVLKNSHQLINEELAKTETVSGTVEEIEQSVIESFSGKGPFTKEKERQLLAAIMQVLSAEKAEGETTVDFETRLKKAVAGVLGITQEAH